MRWEHDRGAKLFLCFLDGEVEIPNALGAQAELTIRASATNAGRLDEKRFEFVQPTDNASEDWLMGRIIMRELPS